MARGDAGVLVDPYGGQADLAAGVLRHVSPAFAEDPLLVLRVARFAARFGFAVAPATEALMRRLVDSGGASPPLPRSACGRRLRGGSWRRSPLALLAVLRDCGALAAVLPEVEALFWRAATPGPSPGGRYGGHVLQALDWAAARGASLPARYAVLTHDLGKADSDPKALPRHIAHEPRSARLSLALSERLRVPQDCRDAAVLVARFHGTVHRAGELRPATLLDLLGAADALRRPERLDILLEACAADACSRRRSKRTSRVMGPCGMRWPWSAQSTQAPSRAATVARASSKPTGGADAVARAVRSARLLALRQWTAARRAAQGAAAIG